MALPTFASTSLVLLHYDGYRSCLPGTSMTVSFLHRVDLDIFDLPLRIPTSIPEGSKLMHVACFEDPQLAQ
jgi:hypothetical protein